MKNILLFSIIFAFSHSAYCEIEGIKHIVLCWLKDADNPHDLRTAVEASRQLKTIPLVDNIVIGHPVASDRNIVDDSFDIGLVMNFLSHDDLERYLTHDEHVRIVKEILVPQCGRIQVYDVAY